ncbi:non-canonical purine NTP pyrophosphatase [Mesoterricola silvestris]|uniref:dITP/XTP pyrophosphatase n=1 Tax=Mesoterricola silvestris TaxID=2927979 RepID=A0AA48GGQ2_9BACT|nr:non-canonical purine NTP pyrophosphatase [Mesoterricola silvestris]BDU70872.1 non-canonical purine NTP pyrophosphatase [Mesoterricola silvestris]
MKILLASRNAGKLREFKDLLQGADLVPWPEDAPEIPEEGAFFQDNALQKATFAKDWWERKGECPVDGVLADDSGLCVDALWGGPGVLSARFARGLGQDAKNRRLLGMIPPGAQRSARFVCVLAWAPMAGEAVTFGGSVEGQLALEPRGGQGFGYDPIFIPEGYDRTFGELPSTAKQGLSHRARASRAFLEAFG